MSCNLMRSVRESDANGLAYSRYPANTNDLATPLPAGLVTTWREKIRETENQFGLAEGARGLLLVTGSRFKAGELGLYIALTRTP